MNNVRVRLPRKLAKSVSNGVLAEAGRLNPVGALGITLNMLPVHRVTMTLAENDLPLAMHDLVEVYNHKGSVGIYRVTKIPHTIRKNRKYELSHGLDVLSDATFDMIEEYKGTVAGMLAKIINAQTQKIGGVKYWQLGTCADPNPWNKDIKYDNLMECLTEIARKEEDYMFTFDQSTFPWTLNFVARDSTVLSEFRLNRNTENCVITEDDTDLCTRLYLSVTSETNDDEGHGTYINEGYFTYNDTDAQNAGFGVVCKTAGVNQEDFTSQAALEAWVAAYFGRHNRPGVQITIDGLELNKITGESIDEVHLSRICRVALPEYSCTFNERIVSVNYPDALRKPLYVRNSLANKRQTAEDAFSEIKKTATSASNSAGSAGRAAHNDATYFRRTIGDTANGLYSRIEQTAYYIRSEVVDTANGLYSKIEQTASYIRAEVADTANGLRSEIEQTASHIRAEVSDTANGLYSKIEETASYIRSEVADTANGLYSKIEETASYIRSEVADTANGLNSRIDQTASYIRSEVSDTANGLYSRIEQTASTWSAKISGVVDSSGNVTIASIVAGVNAQDGSFVKIAAGKIDLSGYVTMTDFNAAKGHIDNLTGGTIVESFCKASLVVGTTLTANNTFTHAGDTIYKRAMKWTSGGGAIATVHATGDTTSIILNHSHAMSVDSSGNVSIGDAQSTTGNFNIADTAFYQNGMSATWDNAYGRCVAPEAGTTASMTVGIPASTMNQSSSYSFTVSADNDYAYIKNALGTVVARCSNPAYGNGWDAAYAKNSVPGAGTSASMDVKMPGSTSGTQSTYSYTVSADNTYAYIKNGVGTVVARCSNPAYGNGWDAAYGKNSVPGAGTSASMDVKMPGSTSGTQSTYTYTVSTDNDYAYIKNGVGTVVARCTNTKTCSHTFGTKSISSNGTFYASTDGYSGFSSVTVSGIGCSHTFGETTYTSNGTYYASTAGYSGFSKVVVNVSCSHTFTTKSISSNGTFKASDDGYSGYTQVTVSGVRTNRHTNCADSLTASGTHSVMYVPDSSGTTISVKVKNISNASRYWYYRSSSQSLFTAYT